MSVWGPRLGDAPEYTSQIFDLKLAKSVLTDLILEYDTLFETNTSQQFQELEMECMNLEKLNKQSDAVKMSLSSWASELRTTRKAWNTLKKHYERSKRMRASFKILVARARIVDQKRRIQRQDAQIAALEDRVAQQNDQLRRVDELLRTLRLPRVSREATAADKSFPALHHAPSTLLRGVRRELDRRYEMESIAALRTMDRTLQKKWNRAFMAIDTRRLRGSWRA